ncbi:MAG: hypothetical protein R2812_07740 [Gelidibacter sp.]|nr:hypothetical protein [Gelidibacter sp.]
MKENEDKPIEKLITKVMQTSTLETPSFDFSSQVMSHIEAFENNKVIIYQPLISKKVWAVIFGCFVAFMVCIFMTTSKDTSRWTNALNFSMFFNNDISKLLSGVVFSKTTTYILMIATVMLLVQLPMLKSYFDKRLKAF